MSQVSPSPSHPRPHPHHTPGLPIIPTAPASKPRGTHGWARAPPTPPHNHPHGGATLGTPHAATAAEAEPAAPGARQGRDGEPPRDAVLPAGRERRMPAPLPADETFPWPPARAQPGTARGGGDPQPPPPRRGRTGSARTAGTGQGHGRANTSTGNRRAHACTGGVTGREVW